jgi:hypothetical protein
MDSYRRNIWWLLAILIISSTSLLSLLLVISCPTQFSEIIKEILIGIVSATLLLLFLETKNWATDKRIYGYLNGEYKRIGIFISDLTKTSDTKYSPQDYDGVDPRIKFLYKGNRQYQFESQHKEGKIKAVIYLDQINPSEGSGVYQYSEKLKDYILPDIGYFKLIVDTLDCKRLYVYHRNLIPSGLAEGYEIWQKV